jgi:CRISPR-associated endonuclease/helicase Cas3
MVFAHSTTDASRADWEPLGNHLQEVGERAATFAETFGWGALARAAGRLHDIGKTSGAYQAYIATPQEDGRRGPDHSTAGAREAECLYGRGFGRLIAYAVAGHHAGLPGADGGVRGGRDRALLL